MFTGNVELLVSAAMLQDLLVNVDGTPLAAGIVEAYKDNDRDNPGGLKNWYYQTGTPGAYTYQALPNPMTLSAAGTINDGNGNDVIPFYYPFSELDNKNIVPEPYFFRVKDANGVTVFTRENFPFNPNGGGGGGSVATSELRNLIVNNRFWRNAGTINVGALTTDFGTAYNSDSKTYFYSNIAPSQHDTFSMPDINFIRNASGMVATSEVITFTKFALDQTPIFTGDVRPEFYINHTATSDTSGATLKVYQFPIALHVNNLQGQEFSFTFQAQAFTPATISVSIYQFLGTGVVSPAPSVLTSYDLTGNWQKFEWTESAFPLTTGLTISPSNDDALYLQINVPIGVACNFNFTLPSIFLNGTASPVVLPVNDFATYDETDSVIHSPRTGDIRSSLNQYYPYGWAPMNDGVLVNLPNPNTVAAPTTGTAYQGIDAFPLFNLIWNSFKVYDVGAGSKSNLIAQMYDSTGALADYGATAISDWSSNKQISLTKMMGRVLMGTVPLPARTPATSPVPYRTTFTAAQLSATFTIASGNGLLCTSTLQLTLGQQIQLSVSGGGTLPGGLMPGTTYYAVPISATQFYISTSLANAQNQVITINLSAGSGTFTVQTFNLTLTTANAVNLFTGAPITFSTTGVLPPGVTATSVFYAVPITTTTVGVALSFAQAISGDLILFTGAGAPTNTISYASAGFYDGEYSHRQLVAELAGHNHPPINPNAAFFVSSGTTGGPNTGTSTTPDPTTGPRGVSFPFNVTQPNTFMNFYIKL